MVLRKGTLTSLHLAIVWIFVTILLIRSATEAEQPLDQRVIGQIMSCLTKGKEAVLSPSDVTCQPYHAGINILHSQNRDMPLGTDAEQVCDDSQGRPNDWRRLPGNAIKLIAAKQGPPIDTRGIRVFGAVFCEQLDLTGLDLAYSLVMDRSLFRKGIEARNFHTRGDLSFDGSLALGTVTLARSHVDGSIYGSNATIAGLQILDSVIGGSIIFRQSLVRRIAVFDTIVLSGELSMRESALSYFLLQFSKIGGVLDLTNSQARCAYTISKSEIRDLVAVDAGFGTTEQNDRFSWRDNAKLPESVQAMYSSSISNPSATHDVEVKCNNEKIATSGEFLVSDARVDSSVCLRSFHWLAPKMGGQPTSFIALNDLNVGASTILDLEPAVGQADADRQDGIGKENRKFELVGIKTHSLIFDFSNTANVEETYLSGLNFEQIYAAKDLCIYDPSFSAPSGPVATRRSQLRLPEVAEVMSWLDRNCLKTTQPFSAFVDASQRSGDDNSAKLLRIARAGKELSLSLTLANSHRLRGMRNIGSLSIIS
jgi:hypothetical protein